MKKFLIIIILSSVLGVLISLFSKDGPDTLTYVPRKLEHLNKIEIYKNKKELILYNYNETYSYPIATGLNNGDKQKIGDNRTPLGNFKVVSIEDSSDWIWDPDGKKDGPIPGAYGPWFVRFDDESWGGIGIHGTHDPDSIGTNASHGCIRMLNKDLVELKEMITLNYQVEIFE